MSIAATGTSLPLAGKNASMDTYSYQICVRSCDNLPNGLVAHPTPKVRPTSHTTPNVDLCGIIHPGHNDILDTQYRVNIFTPKVQILYKTCNSWLGVGNYFQQVPIWLIIRKNQLSTDTLLREQGAHEQSERMECALVMSDMLGKVKHLSASGMLNSL